MVSIVVCTERPSFMNNVFENYERQSYKDKELIIVLNRDDMDINKWRRKASQYKNVSVYRVPQRYEVGKCLNYGIERAKHSIIAKLDDDDYYGRYYLEEAVNKMHRHNVPVIGKNASFIYFESKKALMLYRGGGQNRYRSRIKGGTLTFKKYVWRNVKFNEKMLHSTDVAFLRGCRKRGYKIYSASQYNYVCVRREDVNSHTQKLSTKEYMGKCKLVRHTTDYIPYVTKKVL
ncbi:glycosyltransferase family 2 protein [Gorillibacterium massiliense]|uniref:glycosyltransferase family 2 protein n=1 Tax=Gorillibacterium massiliense TaxID=1280390 RepID=UPI000693EB19|nr:glycosyltransferase [Gorillibacterium massiliense]